MSFRTKAIRFVRHWHARAGVLLAILFLFLAMSGFALNHTNALGLAKSNIRTTWLMRWYGLNPAVPTSGFLFKEGYLAAANGRWVMDGQLLANINQVEANQVPVGAVTWGGMRAVASERNLFLYLPNGQVVDKLSGAALPSKLIKRIGIAEVGATQKLALETPQGNFVTDDGLSWLPLALNQQAVQPIWSREQALPNTLSVSLNRAFAPTLPLERIILDLHSGRIFGRYGPLFMDLAALGLIILSLSGVWIYLRTVRRQQRH